MVNDKEIQDLKRRAGITEEEIPNVSNVVWGLNQAVQKIEAGHADAAKYYIQRVIQHLTKHAGTDDPEWSAFDRRLGLRK